MLNRLDDSRSVCVTQLCLLPVEAVSTNITSTRSQPIACLTDFLRHVYNSQEQA